MGESVRARRRRASQRVIGLRCSLGVNVAGYFEATSQTQFLEDIMDMTLHGINGQMEPLGNLLVAQPCRNQLNHLSLAPRHSHGVAGSELTYAFYPINNLRKERSGQRRRKNLFSFGHKPYRR